jgi:hypothetical protein
VVNEKSETRSRSPRDPFEHLKITIGIAKGSDRAAADELINRDRLAFMMVVKIQLASRTNTGLPSRT